MSKCNSNVCTAVVWLSYGRGSSLRTTKTWSHLHMSGVCFFFFVTSQKHMLMAMLAAGLGSLCLCVLWVSVQQFLFDPWWASACEERRPIVSLPPLLSRWFWQVSQAHVPDLLIYVLRVDKRPIRWKDEWWCVVLENKTGNIVSPPAGGDFRDINFQYLWHPVGKLRAAIGVAS